MGTLCQYCKVLEIDDAAWGGSRDETIAGKNVLSFSGDGTTEEIPHDQNVELLKDYPDEGDEAVDRDSPAQYRRFTCHYNRQDTLPDLPNLKSSAAECGVCALLRHWLRRRLVPNHDQGIISIRSFTYIWYEAVRKNGTQFRRIQDLQIDALVEKVGDEFGDELDARVEVLAPDGPCATWLSIPKEPPRLPDIWENISKIASKISRCSENCGHRKFSDSAPSRLIYVGDETESDGFGDPRLVAMSDSEYLLDTCTRSSIEYAALSYCWGESTGNTLKTTMDSFAAHLQTIPLAEMPATCRDAVLVTRALGLQWLWIDAFCITQDNEADWQKESAEMAAVYGNAFVTIIPLRSHSSHDGFLDQVEQTVEAKVPFRSSIDPSAEGCYTLRTLPTVLEDYSALQKELWYSRWQRRGWTYQENTMSLRKLYFGETDIYFRCGSGRTSTCRSTNLKALVIQGEFWPIEDRSTTIAGRSKRGWYWCLDFFFRRELTFMSDTFPAISAIAEMHCNGVKEDYLCGLWISDLHTGVLWQAGSKKLGREEHLERLASRDGYIAPSWSWAAAYAMGNGASYRHQSTSPFWEILETKSGLLTASNPLGPVLSGHILVKGRWCALSSLRLDYPGLWYNSLFPILSETRPKWRDVFEFDWEIKDTDLNETGKLSADFTERLAVLLVAEEAGALGSSNFRGILLTPAAEKEAWYRVGTFFRMNLENVDKDELIGDWGERIFKMI